MNKLRLSDVAKEAGVSIATASLVLNGKGRISEKVQIRVLDWATKTISLFHSLSGIRSGPLGSYCMKIISNLSSGTLSVRSSLVLKRYLKKSGTIPFSFR